jgi:hypothetical protein
MSIEQKFGVDLGVTGVGSLLAKLQLTPQKPLQRAYQRNPEAIALWQEQTYPALGRQAKRDGAQILFGTNPIFVPTPCMARRGDCAARRLLCIDLGNGSRSRRPLQ